MVEEFKEEIKEVKPLRKRYQRCCVPNCLTYGPSEIFIAFPSSDSVLRRAWLDAIPRSNWYVCHDTRICKNHFVSNDSEGRIAETDVPKIFPKPATTNLENKYRKIDKGMFQISANYALPETFGDLAMLPNCDRFIFDFFSLLQDYKNQLKVVLDVCRWMTRETADRLDFYQLSSPESGLKISTSISIDSQLKPTIALEGIVMDPLDYTRHVPVNGRITHWDQLNLMLLDYGFNRETENKDQVPPLLIVRTDNFNPV